jgi:hypothetical protein
MEASLRVVVCDNCFKNLLVQAGRFSQSVAMRWRPSFSTAAMLTLSRCTVAWLGFTSGMLSRPADIQATYRQAESEARAQRRGLWSDSSPVEPWLYRRAAKRDP